MTTFYLTQEDIDECTETREACEAQLLDIEARLASEFGLTGDNIRDQLLTIEATGVLDDGDIGLEWRFTLDRWLYHEDLALRSV